MKRKVIENLAKRISGSIPGQMHVTLPDGSAIMIGDGATAPVTDVTLHDGAVVTRLMSQGWPSFGETYLEGLWSTTDLQALLDQIHMADEDMFEREFGGSVLTKILGRLKFWLQRNHKKQAKKNISYHYDLGNDFYGLWLDDTMTYSSAIFDTGQEAMEAAQTAKYASMVDQMGVKPGDHVLEIGCGWGGFAEYAAKERGLKVTCLTISEEQYKYAVDRIAKAGLADQVTFKLQDYRDEAGQYDGIASIEMFEAVGEQYWPAYFNTVRDNLRPGAQATLQIITVEDHRFEVYRDSVDFIQKYIFPGGMLPSPSVLRKEIDKAGLSFVKSIKFGQSYSTTLRRWHDTFNEKWDQVQALGFDDRFRRMWNFYLTSCASTFKFEDCDVTQVTIKRPG